MKKDSVIPYFFILPIMTLFFLFIIYPLFIEIIYSFFNKKLGLKPVFVGFDNFVKLTNDPLYIHTLWNTFVPWCGVAVNIKMLLALLFANYLAETTRFRRVIRAIILLPWALPLITCLSAWRWIWDPDWGVINRALQTFFACPPLPLFAEYKSAFGLIILFHIWKWTPFWTLIFLGGLQGLPPSLYESAKIDGAGRFEIFKYITWPLIKPLYIICTLLSMVWTLGDFTTVWVLTQGAPAESTHVLATLAYRYAFLHGDLSTAYTSFTIILPLVLGMILILIRKIEGFLK